MHAAKKRFVVKPTHQPIAVLYRALLGDVVQLTVAQKKKCDEVRPQCSRCAEHGIECAYEAVKPRQRKKREGPLPDGASDGNSGPYSPGRRFSEAGSEFLADGDESDGDEEEVATEPRGRPGRGSMMVRARSVYPDLAMISPFPAASPLLEFCPPLFADFSDRPNRRALLDHFCNVLSHLIVFREESGNPFQQLVLPLTQKSSPVMNAMYALASAHLEYRGVDNAEKSLYFHNRAIQGLGRLIENNGKVNRNEILAAIMLLVYYEVVSHTTAKPPIPCSLENPAKTPQLVQKGQSNIVAVHLKGALTVMCANPDPTNPTSAFLERVSVCVVLSPSPRPLSITKPFSKLAHTCLRRFGFTMSLLRSQTAPRRFPQRPHLGVSSPFHHLARSLLHRLQTLIPFLAWLRHCGR